MSKSNSIRQLIFAGLMAALVFVGTKLINIPTPRGYIHIGDSMIFVSAFLLNWKYAALASGIGSSLADLLSPYAVYTLPTFVIKSIMSLLVSFTIHASKKAYRNLNIIVSFLWISSILILKNLLKISLTNKPEIYLDALEHLGVTSIVDVLSYGKTIDIALFFIAFIFPLIFLSNGFLLYDKKKLRTLIGYLLSGTWMVFAYYLFEAVFYGQFIVPVLSIPTNVLQFFVGALLAHLLSPGLQILYKRIHTNS